MRESLICEASDSNKVVVATLTMVYDHHLPNLSQKLTETQHHAHGKVLAATHVHLDDDYCLEGIIMKGRSMRGVKHGKLVVTSTGKEEKRVHLLLRSPISQTRIDSPLTSGMP
jgi:CopG family nickel-responsive transcriptional regulator